MTDERARQKGESVSEREIPDDAKLTLELTGAELKEIISSMLAAENEYRISGQDWSLFDSIKERLWKLAYPE